MQASLAQQYDNAPWAPYRCPRCRRCDSIPMPRASVFDKLMRALGCAPYKCRACRAKFYRRTMPRDPNPPEIEESTPVSEAAPNVAVCQRDRTKTLRRVENIIRAARGKGPRRGSRHGAGARAGTASRNRIAKP